MHPEINLFGLTIQSFGLCLGAAFLVAGWLAAKRLKELDRNVDFAYEMVFAALIGGIIGAKLWYIAENGGPLFSGTGLVFYGGLIWPVNGPITSPFCESRAWESCHPGIDIGVPAGTPIRAAAAGKVVLMQGEASSGGYGNFTCIQHTGSLSTCYAHQSRFGTSMGARVSQGQVIGYVGCTGRCFGDHLHFETRINGSVVNPMNYL